MHSDAHCAVLGGIGCERDAEPIALFLSSSPQKGWDGPRSTESRVEENIWCPCGHHRLQLLLTHGAHAGILPVSGARSPRKLDLNPVAPAQPNPAHSTMEGPLPLPPCRPHGVSGALHSTQSLLIPGLESLRCVRWCPCPRSCVPGCQGEPTWQRALMQPASSAHVPGTAH